MSEVVKREIKVYFEGDGFQVTSRNLKTPRKTYKISRIEKIALRRDPFYFALALAVPALGLLFSFNNLLYDYERYILIGGSIFFISATSQLGLLFVESKALSDVAAIGKLSTLRAVREAVESVLDEMPDRDDEF